MPRALASIPEIVVGNITQGEVVLRNVVVSPHYATDGGGGIYTRPIDSVTPWSPNQTQGQLAPAKQFDTAITPNDFSKLSADTRVIFIDGDEVINASRDEAPDFFMNGAYFVGAFAPEAADAVIADMMNSPMPSPEEQNVGSIVAIMNLQLGFGMAALTYFNAYLDAEEAWEDFEGIEDNETILLSTQPVPGVQVPENFPAEREILITYNPDYTGDTAALGRRVYNEIITKASKAVLSSSQRHDGKEAGSTAYAKYLLWIPDSVTDLQALEAIRNIMKNDSNVMITTKRITPIDAPIPGTQAPLPLVPEENKQQLGDKYQQILEQLQVIGSVANPQYESLQKRAQVIAEAGGVSGGCSPDSPQSRPPEFVANSCLPPRPPPPTPKPKPKLPPKPSPAPQPPGTNSGGIGKLFVDKTTGLAYTRDEVLARENISAIVAPSNAQTMQDRLLTLPSKYTYLG